jgi:DoxX-like family
MASPELRWLRLSLVFVWLWTAFASLWEWNGQSLALLSALPETWPGLKPTLIGAGAATDALLGVWLWWRPGRAAYGAALIGMGVMTVLATVVDPGWWLHPLGPLSKNVPIAAALLLLWRLDERT